MDALLKRRMMMMAGGGPTPPEPTIQILEWDSPQRFQTTRYYKFLSGTVQEGDVLKVSLNDYATYKFGVVVAASKSYTATAISDTGWITNDLTKVISSAESGKYLRIAIAKANNGTISISEGDAAIDTLLAERIINA